MSIHSVKQYLSEIEKIIHFGGTKKETAIRTAFQNLLNEYAKQKGLLLIPEITIRTAKGKNVTPDGTLKDSLRQDWGYWESKDEEDDIDEEIKKKFAKDYPKDNILFEDSSTAVLFQSNYEAMRVSMRDEDALHRIIIAFINYERPEVQNFRKAIELFKQDVPKVTETLRGIIEAQTKTNKKFVVKRAEFHELCKDAINPMITVDDITEMMIQHILTADIFNTIFDEPYFHRENNIAKELEKVLETFFTGNTRKLALGTIQHYYQTMNASAAGIADHHEKQTFLKVVYETFYKSYNPKAADRLGVVYTPNEIVRFMIESTDHLLNKYFSKSLVDKNVEILDPATGTGTYICELIDYIRAGKLEYKYKNEIHANEVSILPYYIANLNIEFTYKQRMNAYAEFESLCFVDTLDNMGFGFAGKQTNMFGVSAENSARIKRQNEKKISVIIGNPPYNANQANENDNNKNRAYDEIDKRIKNSFIKYSTAQKTKVYDMYARFYRWAFDRLGDNGVISFITNRSFIDSRTFDGFRKVVASEFDYVYIIDLGGDVRANPKLSGTKHNVFGIQTGVAIMFLVKLSGPIEAKTKAEFKELKKKFNLAEEPVVIYNEKEYRSTKGCTIYYVRRPELETKDEKLQYLASSKLSTIEFERIRPDKNENWINLADNDFESLLPLISKDVKLGKSDEALFKFFTLGTVSNRDEWVYDFDQDFLEQKIKYFINQYNFDLKKLPIGVTEDEIVNHLSKNIKYTRDLKKRLFKRRKIQIQQNEFRDCNYRVFNRRRIYFSPELNEMRYQTPLMFPSAEIKNQLIAINQGSKPFNVLSSKHLVDLHFNGDSQCVPLYYFDEKLKRIDNITDWGLAQFQTHYNSKKITKEEIFNYVYAVLHNPAYRTKYELNLKREFPRIPFYENFIQWSKWGKLLMDLHINYEEVKPYKLKELTSKEIVNPKAKLKANREEGTIVIDEATSLTGIPTEAWDYKLGNRSALEWVLDQYKEGKPKDPTIAEKFNIYKFSEYKEHVIELLKKVCTVSVETMSIVDQMPEG